MLTATSLDPRRDASSPYSLVASAMAGRQVAVRVGDTNLAYTDGETIFLPDGDEESTLVGLVVQGALLGANSLEPQIVARLIGRPSPTRRYLTLEVARAIGGIGLPAPRRVRDRLGEHWNGPVPGSATESLRRALNGERVPEAPERYGTIRPRRLLAGGGLAVGAALTRKDVQGRTPHVPLPELDDDEESEESKILKLFSSPFSWENPLFKLLRNQLGMGRHPKPDGADKGGAELPVGAMTAVTKTGPHATLVTEPAPVRADVVAEPSGDFLYPEWDGHRRAYRARWCRVGEFLPAAASAPTELRPCVDYRLRRELAALGLSYTRHAHQVEGDGLDISSLVDFAVSKALGETPDDRVYQARLRTAHDLGVVVLLDASGSTTTCAHGTPIWEQHRELAANLVSALERVGDRVAAYAFNSRGRNSIRFLLVKEFDGRFDHGAIRRLASVEPAGFTRLGAAIRHATHLVRTRAGTGHRLLVVVSDGFAYDDGYQGTYAELDTRRALDEAVRQGVACACVSVATGTDRAMLERLWGSVTHVQLTEAGELSHHVIPMFRAALKAVNVASDPRIRTTLER